MTMEKKTYIKPHIQVFPIHIPHLLTGSGDPVISNPENIEGGYDDNGEGEGD